jgi:hypothetical protein
MAIFSHSACCSKDFNLENELANVKLHLNKKTNQFTEATKANKRLKILSEQLQEDQDYITARMTAMEQIFKEINDEKSKMVKENQEYKIAKYFSKSCNFITIPDTRLINIYFWVRFFRFI